MSALLAYLASPPGEVKPPADGQTAHRYTIDGYAVFLDQHGVPAIAPPWGTLNAIDLVKGEILWKVPLGEYPQLVAKGIRNTGSMNFGGAVATAGGLIFVAATADEKIRAFEKHTGRVLWEHQLPAGGYATPDHLYARRQTVCRHRRRRQRQERHEVGRLDCRLRAFATGYDDRGPPCIRASAPRPRRRPRRSSPARR